MLFRSQQYQNLLRDNTVQVQTLQQHNQQFRNSLRQMIQQSISLSVQRLQQRVRPKPIRTLGNRTSTSTTTRTPPFSPITDKDNDDNQIK